MNGPPRDAVGVGDAVVVDLRRSPNVRLRPVPIAHVTLSDDFWAPRRRTNGERTLRSQHRHLEATHTLDNFRRAAGRIDGDFAGMYFADTDVYKWLEAVAWHLADHPEDAELRRLADEAVEVVAAAQRPDGYLNTYFARERADERWTNFDLHEMYCAGHLFQAAVAYHRTTGDRRLLEIATRFADHICDTFGPAPDQRVAIDGHEEVELGLVELYRTTGVRRYLERAEFFVEARGRGLLGRPYGQFDPEYSQDHAPFRDMDAVVGHAVRELYYTAGVADLCAELDEPGYRAALERLWHNMTERRMYVSGGVGSRHEGEAFGDDYELPHARAYTETCAAIASVMWNWRMLALSGEARFADLLEWTLVNAVLPGLSLDGDAYFYQNPLTDDGRHRRRPWFGVACCPPNVARLLGSLPSYLYTVTDDELWVHLYAAGSVDTLLPDGRRVALEQRTAYPWDGTVELTVRSEGRFALQLRVPAWCESGARLTVAGEAVREGVVPGSYVRLERDWRAGDRVELHLPMPVRYLGAHRRVSEAAGRAALARGPVLYCVEGADHPGLDPRDLILPSDPSAFAIEPSDLPGALPALSAEATCLPPDEGSLYRALGDEPEPFRTRLTAIPYFAWANREPGPMQVWTLLPRADRSARVGTAEREREHPLGDAAAFGHTVLDRGTEVDATDQAREGGLLGGLPERPVGPRREAARRVEVVDEADVAADQFGQHLRGGCGHDRVPGGVLRERRRQQWVGQRRSVPVGVDGALHVGDRSRVEIAELGAPAADEAVRQGHAEPRVGLGSEPQPVAPLLEDVGENREPVARRGRRGATVVGPELSDLALLRGDAAHARDDLEGLVVEARAGRLVVRRGRRRRTVVGGTQSEGAHVTPIRLQRRKRLADRSGGGLPHAGSFGQEEVGVEVGELTQVPAIFLGPRVERGRQRVAVAPRALDRRGVPRAGMDLGPARLEFVQCDGVLAAHALEQLARQGRERGIGDLRLVHAGGIRRRQLRQARQGAGQRPVARQRGDDGLVERDPRVGEGSRGHRRTEPRGLSHQRLVEVEPIGREVRAMRVGPEIGCRGGRHPGEQDRGGDTPQRPAMDGSHGDHASTHPMSATDPRPRERIPRAPHP